jgi:hypothetical protein
MPPPRYDRQALEQERDVELPAQLAGYKRDLETTPRENKERRERLEWQIRRVEKRMATLRRGWRRSVLNWERCISGLDDLRPARAGEPHRPAIPATVQFSTALMLSDEGHQGAEDFWHGAGRLSQR